MLSFLDRAKPKVLDPVSGGSEMMERIDVMMTAAVVKVMQVTEGPHSVSH